MSEIRADKIHNVTGDNDSGIDLSTNDVVAIDIAGSEKARVDSSGNLFVGTTVYTGNTTGAGAGFIDSSGVKTCFASGAGTTGIFNRLTSDGSIVQFRKDGSTVGVIASSGTTMGIGNNSNAGIRFAGSRINPTSGGATDSDNAMDIGNSGARFDDIFATNGTIQTSDQQEKNTITDSDLGIDFIKRLTPKSYIFNGKTRTHYGLIAQDVETVLGDISKPTSGFAGFIKDDISEEQDGSEYRYGLRYTEFVAPLIQAVKDQQAIIEDLQARITALESE